MGCKSVQEDAVTFFEQHIEGVRQELAKAFMVIKPKPAQLRLKEADRLLAEAERISRVKRLIGEMEDVAEKAVEQREHFIGFIRSRGERPSGEE